MQAPESTSTQSRDYNIRALKLLAALSKPESTSTQSRDYNYFLTNQCRASSTAGININPVAGLQHSDQEPIAPPLAGRNQHQPSRGITTTHRRQRRRRAYQPESTSTQSRDYNTADDPYVGVDLDAGININPVAGLQHRRNGNYRRNMQRRNQHQPSRGITTIMQQVKQRTQNRAGININPVAGLQHALCKVKG